MKLLKPEIEKLRLATLIIEKGSSQVKTEFTTKEMEMEYEKPRLLTLYAFSEIRAASKCLGALLEGAPPYLYVNSPNAYESDE